ncbi:MAG TPA: flagellar hook protein FlgE [Firmicutes bacterium]|nr:flagellar hook protein FlgE [Bacillota bacterium]
MMRSLFSGLAGMRTQQQSMDVIGNNIANVNTTGYKAARVNFEDLLYQSMRTVTGAVNPMQVGGGVRVGSIDTLYGQGSPNPTGNLMDVTIIGRGFIVLNQNDSQVYTRSGNLSFDQDGYLFHTSTGLRVMGWNANVNGQIRPGTDLVELRAKPGERVAAKASTGVSFAGVLDARLPIDSVVQRDFTVIDALGQSRSITIEFTRTSASEWTWSLVNPSAGSFAGPADGQLVFGADGTLSSGGTLPAMELTFADGITPDLQFTLDFSSCLLTGGDTNLAGAQTGGVAAGALSEVQIDEKGYLIGIFSNGVTRNLGQIALATFANEGGLERAGGSLFKATTSSGNADTSRAPGDERGTFSPGSLEMSNVDLTQEFASMILSQRAFQANSRVVTTTDELLQEVVNLRR